MELPDQSKIHRDSALAGLTNVQRYLMYLMLMPHNEIIGRFFTFSQLKFLPQMKKLVETETSVNILNQLCHLTQGYACRPNTTLWFNFFKVHEFLPPGGLGIGSCSVFMMIPGYFNETADKAALQYDMSMRASGEESDDDFRRLLRDFQYVAPTTTDEAWIMLNGVVDFLEEVVDGVCIASTGYALTANLMLKYGLEINRFIYDMDEPHFLMQLLHQVDRECYFLFQECFDDIKTTEDLPYEVNTSQITKHNTEITDIFEVLKRNKTSSFKIPPPPPRSLGSAPVSTTTCHTGTKGRFREKSRRKWKSRSPTIEKEQTNYQQTESKSRRLECPRRCCKSYDSLLSQQLRRQHPTISFQSDKHTASQEEALF